ncbi:MAG: phage portal protein [Microbacteriaceae bacterium]
MFDVGSPEWWVGRLERRLRDERATIDLHARWYDGDQPRAVVGEKCTDAYRLLLSRARRNWASLVVDAAADRLYVDGFKFSVDSGSDPWTDIWQANDLDAESSAAMLEALITGRCPVMVADDGGPRVTVEDPRETIVEHGPGGRGRLAALKMFTAGSERVAELMLPGALHRWVGPAGDPSDMMWADTLGSRFSPRQDLAGPADVPVVELRANTRVGRGPRSELAGRTDTLEAIDKLTADMLVAAEYGAFRQRWVTGLEVQTDQHGNPIQPFRHAVDRLFVGENPDIRFGEFSATDLGNYLSAISDQVTHLAAITKTPPHYLLSGMTNLSADAIRAAEASLVTRVRRHQRAFGEVWEQVMRMALAVTGDARATDTAVETQWKNAETRTAAELADALVKMSALGVPFAELMAWWGASPQDIDRMQRDRTRDALLAPTAAPNAVAPV